MRGTYLLSPPEFETKCREGGVKGVEIEGSHTTHAAPAISSLRRPFLFGHSDRPCQSCAPARVLRWCRIAIGASMTFVLARPPARLAWVGVVWGRAVGCHPADNLVTPGGKRQAL